MAPLSERAVWRSVMMESGAQCVTMPGAQLKLMLSVDSLDSERLV